MKEIGASQLATLLEKGFEGEITFEGRVCGRVSQVHPQEPNGSFYEGNGKFRLLAPSSGRKGYTLIESGSSFRFAVRPEEKIVYSHEEKYGPAIVIPITLNERAVLQIEPRGRILF